MFGNECYVSTRKQLPATSIHFVLNQKLLIISFVFYLYFGKVIFKSRQYSLYTFEGGDVEEARRGQRHFLANLSVISGHIQHLNFTDCVGGKGFALDPKKQLTNPLVTFPFSLSLGTLLSDAYHQCIQQKKSLGPLLLIYHQIIGCGLQSFGFDHIVSFSNC